MNTEEINYVNDLIFANLAQYKSVNIDGLGSLKCVMKFTRKNYSKSVKEAPKYEVFFTEECVGDSVSQLITEKTNCAPKEAKEMVAEWLGDLKKKDKDKISYSITNVGVISVPNNVKTVFICDKKLLELLQPLSVKGMKNSTAFVATDNVAKTKPEEENGRKKVVLFIVLSVVALLLGTYFVAPNVFGIKADNEDVAENVITEMPLDVEETETVDSLQEKAVTIPTKDGYYVIVNTFNNKENADKLLLEVSKNFVGAEILEVVEHKKTPYFVSIGKFDNYEDARKVMNSSDYEETWVYHYND